MKIVNSTVAMEGHSRHISEETTVSNLRMWDNRSTNNNTLNGNPLPIEGDKLNLSLEGLNLSALQLSQTEETEESSLESSLSEKDLNKIRLLEKLLESLTGKKFKFDRFIFKELKDELREAAKGPKMPTAIVQAHAPAQSNGPQPVGWGIQFHHEEHFSMKETVDFKTTGSVTTADGRSIDFQLNYHFSQAINRSIIVDFKAGDALLDPLVIRLDEGPLEFSDEPIVFDLDIDGTQDAFKVPINNAGFLFLDKNGNQIADDGTELFGPRTDNGFGELAALDADQNGWIDEGDAAFNDLRIWIRSGDGTDRYLGLIEAGVGALFVSGTRTEAGLYDSATEQLGQMKATGFYLKESGQAGLVHELDFKV